jgi:hypothetical protein
LTVVLVFGVQKLFEFTDVGWACARTYHEPGS